MLVFPPRGFNRAFRNVDADYTSGHASQICASRSLRRWRYPALFSSRVERQNLYRSRCSARYRQVMISGRIALHQAPTKRRAGLQCIDSPSPSPTLFMLSEVMKCWHGGTQPLIRQIEKRISKSNFIKIRRDRRVADISPVNCGQFHHDKIPLRPAARIPISICTR